MSPDFIEKWEKLLDDVDMQRIPIEFIKKLIIKLEGKRQKTINIERLADQGLDPVEIEDIVGRQLYDLEDEIVRVDYILNVKHIADTVQPETDRLLNDL